MITKLSRTAKLTPAPGEFACLADFRHILLELAEIGMGLARQTGANALTLPQTLLAQSADCGKRTRQAPPAPNPAITIFNQLVRTIKTCMDLHQKLGAAVATAEIAGLNQTDRHAILDDRHVAIRCKPPSQVRRSPEDVIVQIELYDRQPDRPDFYPNSWRPTPMTPA